MRSILILVPTFDWHSYFARFEKLWERMLTELILKHKHDIWRHVQVICIIIWKMYTQHSQEEEFSRHLQFWRPYSRAQNKYKEWVNPRWTLGKMSNFLKENDFQAPKLFHHQVKNSSFFSLCPYLEVLNSIVVNDDLKIFEDIKGSFYLYIIRNCEKCVSTRCLNRIQWEVRVDFEKLILTKNIC